MSEGGVDAHHGELDHVGGGALQRGVDGGALGEPARVGVAAVDVGNGALATEEGSGHAGLPHFGYGFIEPSAHADVAFEIVLDVFFRFGARNAKLRGESEAADAVDDAEIDG